MLTGPLSRQVNHQLCWIDVVVVVTFCVLVALGWHESKKKYPDGAVTSSGYESPTDCVWRRQRDSPVSPSSFRRR